MKDRVTTKHMALTLVGMEALGSVWRRAKAVTCRDVTVACSFITVSCFTWAVPVGSPQSTHLGRYNTYPVAMQSPTDVCRVATVGRAPDLQSEGRGFKPQCQYLFQRGLLSAVVAGALCIQEDTDPFQNNCKDKITNVTDMIPVKDERAPLYTIV